MSAPLMDIALFTIALLANVVFTIVQLVIVSLLAVSLVAVPSLMLSTHRCAPRPFNRPIARSLVHSVIHPLDRRAAGSLNRYILHLCRSGSGCIGNPLPQPDEPDSSHGVNPFGLSA